MRPARCSTVRVVCEPGREACAPADMSRTRPGRVMDVPVRDEACGPVALHTEEGLGTAPELGIREAAAAAWLQAKLASEAAEGWASAQLLSAQRGGGGRGGEEPRDRVNQTRE